MKREYGTIIKIEPEDTVYRYEILWVVLDWAYLDNLLVLGVFFGFNTKEKEMVKGHKPRSGSMQFWPRKRAKKETPRVRNWPQGKDAVPLGFGGYKVGMTHVLYSRPRKGPGKKGAAIEDVACPVTVVECPPLKLAGVRLYKDSYEGLAVAKEILFTVDKELSRKRNTSKKVDQKAIDTLDLSGMKDLRLLVYSQPKLTGIGKKKPELFELGLGGKLEEKLAWAKEHVGKEIGLTDVFKPGEHVDFLGVTKGKGFQGAVKRFGISIRARKSEKGIRAPGSLGGWKGHGHFMYRVAHAGQMGYHRRLEHNKWLLKIGDKPEEINVKGGFLRYGLVKNTYLLVKGSIQGPAKRFVMFTQPRRPSTKIPKEAPVLSIDLGSQQR
jgi:large subunit ribosomal protein L3